MLRVGRLQSHCHCSSVVGGLVSVAGHMHKEEIEVDERLVRELLHSQMPDLAHLPLEIVEPWGTDNAVWRLGTELVVRLPRIHWASGQAEFEAQWLPRLAPYLPVEIPEPIAIGESTIDYPYRWAVHRWISGQGAAPDRINDPVAFALALAEVVRTLQAVSTTDAPPATNRARPLAEFDEATRWCIERASHLIDAAAAIEVWEEALAAPPHRGVWSGCRVTWKATAWSTMDSSAALSIGVPPAPAIPPSKYRSSGHLCSQASRDALSSTRSTSMTQPSPGVAVRRSTRPAPLCRTLNTYPLIVERSWHKLAMLGVRPLHSQ